MSTPPNPEVAILNAALDLRPEERAAYLDKACAGDTELRRRVEGLLQAHEQAGDFLETPPTGLDPAKSPRLSVPLAEKPGDKIGHYKLLQQIGEGGCGVVYMAEQEEPVRRRVALKVIKLGMDTKSVIARFEAERQALALMDHPNIARVYDAGATATGRPYFVMELVRGVKITDFCDENKVPTQERLRLFIQVCEAIQHAHQKGIIHRDIKPSNILVTVNDGVPVPKVIDFGIAKATQGRLTDQTLFTAFEQFLGTPAYMSPEQAVMTSLDIDTRSDIYSLGVLPYELLTGKTPFEQKELLAAGLDEMRRTIRDKEPPKPSARLSAMVRDELTTTASRRHTDAPRLLHTVRGDLDWIVMKCLEKDRTGRYETANGLARDLERHLGHEPVTARPPSRLYEFQKTVRRHRFGFAAAGAVGVALVLGMVGSALEAARAKRAERDQIRLREQAQASQRKSQTEAAKAAAISDFMQEMLRSANPEALKGSAYTVRQMLDDFSAGLGNQLEDAEVEATVRAAIGRAYYRLGVADKAQAQHERALALRRRIFGNQSDPVAESLVDYAWASFEQGQWAKAESQAREALAIYREHGATGQPVISAFWVLQTTLVAAQRRADAEAVAEEALNIASKTPGVECPELASFIHGLAELRNQQSRYAEAEVLANKAVAMHRRLRREGDLEIGWALLILGHALRGEQKLDEAERALQEALGIFRKQYATGHKSVDLTRDELEAILEAKRDFGGLVALYQSTLAEQRTLLGNDDPAVAETLLNLAEVLKAQGKQADAEELSAEAVGMSLKANGRMTTRTPAVVRRQAQALKDLGKSRDGEKLFEEMINRARQKPGETNLILGEFMHDYGDFLGNEGKSEAAAEYHFRALPIRRTQQDDNLAWTLRSLGGELVQIGKPSEAEGYLRESLALYRKLHQQEDIGATAWPTERLGYALYLQHKLPAAEQAYRDALRSYAIAMRPKPRFTWALFVICARCSKQRESMRKPCASLRPSTGSRLSRP